MDDIVILTLFLGSKKYKLMEVYIGQYVGIASLVAVSLAGAWLGTFVESK